jgi:hypothetical protein
MKMRRVLLGGVAAATAALAVLTGACAPKQEATPEGGGAMTIDVKLQEWSVVPDSTSAPAGEITFDVQNAGKKDHEFMVVRTDLDLTALPSEKNGSFDMEGDDVEVVDAMNAAMHGDDEHTVVEPGKDKDFEYELEEGAYVLLCNLVDEKDGKETDVHFKMGMRIPFEVS